jgi:hypothetical protein
MMQQRQKMLGFDFIRFLFGHSVFAKFSFGFGTAGIEPPSLTLQSSQMRPFTLTLGATLGQGINFGIGSSVMEGVGYNLSLNLAENETSIAPQISYKITPNIEFTGQCEVALMSGSFSHNLTMGYMLGEATQAQVDFSREFEDYGEKLKSRVTLSYLHQGYAFKVPIMCYEDSSSSAGLAMTSGLFLMANLGSYLMLRYRQS